MELLTKAIKNKLSRLYSNEKKPANRVPIVVKFFTPDANWTWYATEADAIVQNPDGTFREEAANYDGPDKVDDIQFFGFVKGLEGELGYFNLSELKEIRGAFGLPIERDMHFGEHTLAEVMQE